MRKIFNGIIREMYSKGDRVRWLGTFSNLPVERNLLCSAGGSWMCPEILWQCDKPSLGEQPQLHMEWRSWTSLELFRVVPLQKWVGSWNWHRLANNDRSQRVLQPERPVWVPINLANLLQHSELPRSREFCRCKSNSFIWQCARWRPLRIQSQPEICLLGSKKIHQGSRKHWQHPSRDQQPMPLEEKLPNWRNCVRMPNAPLHLSIQGTGIPQSSSFRA